MGERHTIDRESERERERGRDWREWRGNIRKWKEKQQCDHQLDQNNVVFQSTNYSN